jgi:NAD(P)-dependent dehydrogenase (short-subunit alcohol dehydrogenase family)
VTDGVAWSTADIPDLTGRRALVTGVTSGLGEAIALELARAGAEVVLAARSATKLDATEADLRRQLPDPRLRRLLVDLADLGSVRRAAAEVVADGPLHLLVNNAGVMATPYQRTGDGFELQLATNFLGPFALTGLLLPALVASGDGRVVNTGSQAHRVARRAPLEDPRVGHGRYSRWHAYAQSKLANLMATFELDRRLRAAGLPVNALAAHPGFVSSRLVSNGNSFGPLSRIADVAYPIISQRPGPGAWPSLMAATADLPGGTYVGPSGPGELQGAPQVVTSSRLSHDAGAQQRLWEVSERTTGISYP